MARFVFASCHGDDSVQGEGSFSPDRRREGKGKNRMGARRQELKWMLVSNVLATLVFFGEQNRVE